MVSRLEIWKGKDFCGWVLVASVTGAFVGVAMPLRLTPAYEHITRNLKYLHGRNRYMLGSTIFGKVGGSI